MASSVAEDAKVGAHGAAMPFGSSGPTGEKEEAMSTATQATSESNPTNKRRAAEEAELRENTARAALRIAARKGKVVVAVPKPKDAAKGKRGAKDERARATKPAAASKAEPKGDAPKAEPRMARRYKGAIYKSPEDNKGLIALCKEVTGKNLGVVGAITELGKALGDKFELVELDDAGNVAASRKNGNGGGKKNGEPRTPRESKTTLTDAIRAGVAEYRKLLKAGKKASEMPASVTQAVADYRAALRAANGVEPKARKPKAEKAPNVTKAEILAIVNDAANDAMTVGELRAKLFPVVAQPEGEQQSEATNDAPAGE